MKATDIIMRERDIQYYDPIGPSTDPHPHLLVHLVIECSYYVQVNHKLKLVNGVFAMIYLIAL